MWKEFSSLFLRELQMEIRQKVAIGGIALFVLSTVFVCYLSFHSISQVSTWNALFWIIVLFTAFNAIGKSFSSDGSGQQLYFYSLASPRAVILAKMAYNLILMVLLSALSLVVYGGFIGREVLMGADLGQFTLAMALGAGGFAMSLTLISGIAAKTNNSLGMMAILGFPIVLPLLITLLRVSKNALDGLAWSVNQNNLLILLAMNVLVAALSYLLFPYLWRE